MKVWLGNHTPDIEVVISVSNWPELMTHPEFPVDVVLLDIDLKDGLPLATKMSAIRSSGSRVALMSSLTDRETIASAYESGAHSYVSKSEPVETIIAAVTAAYEEREFISDEGRAQLTEPVAADERGLAPKQRRVMAMYAEGMQMKQIADKLRVSEETVRSHLTQVRKKYRQQGINLNTKVAIRRQAVADGIIHGVNH